MGSKSFIFSYHSVMFKRVSAPKQYSKKRRRLRSPGSVDLKIFGNNEYCIIICLKSGKNSRIIPMPGQRLLEQSKHSHIKLDGWIVLTQGGLGHKSDQAEPRGLPDAY